MSKKNKSPAVPEKQTLALRTSMAGEPQLTGIFMKVQDHEVRLVDDGFGIWHATVKLESGGHQYLFLVNSWPGNLRELRHVIKRAVVTARDGQPYAMDPPAKSDDRDASSELPVQTGSFVTLEKLEEAHLRKILERTASLTAAAAILGIDQATLYRKRKKIGLLVIRDQTTMDVPPGS